jgi:hypothetical protein
VEKIHSSQCILEYLENVGHVHKLGKSRAEKAALTCIFAAASPCVAPSNSPRFLDNGMKFYNNRAYSNAFPRLAMRKKLSLCSTASAKLRRQSLDLEPGAIGARAWQAHVRAYVSASDGEEKYYAKSVGKCRRYKTVCLSRVVLSSSCVQIFLGTAGLTDYEVRDLNDEINKLMREKRHWENQIISLGGTNYRRNVAMLDDDGREVPGIKGYKYADPSPTKHLFAF